ncbi:MAG TPA: DUF4240 domain-containing protein [Leptospiraceae bacterium]|nr:DUF4240 domain-containing protein [Leptospiraceae bacterium]HMY65594.1 DUF4240 domain-containing protein [Leptospiraceae bacterium]HMZ57913.1 DUF4240 domain-containing protein [Leptospiraceae bacterium]HNF12757.1 DUF4240 domain-containing protein [Leptospiraceae bacterium]HNF23528.1 DUF4240 domain-containing protein [Leptospiraceae bacterium]
MNTDEFWSLIKTARETCKTDGSVLKYLKKKISEKSEKEIGEFDSIYVHYVRIAEAAPAALLIYEISGSRTALASEGKGYTFITGDSFFYFCFWLVSLGKDLFFSALENPDVLAGRTKKNQFKNHEYFLYIASEAYEKKTGSMEGYEQIADADYGIKYKDKKIKNIKLPRDWKKFPELCPNLCRMFKYSSPKELE